MTAASDVLGATYLAPKQGDNAHARDRNTAFAYYPPFRNGRRGQVRRE